MLEILLYIYLSSVIISIIGLLIFREGTEPIDSIDVLVVCSIGIIPGINLAALIGEILY